MSVDEKYALNWSSHADHLKEAFDKILEAKDFVDVTLSCEGKKIKAHRVILSACSSYFYDILKDNPCSHPTIVLRDIAFNNVGYLLKFMYCGEVQVPTEDFGSFLQTAELLQVSGLTGTNSPTRPTKDHLKKEQEPPAPEKSKTLSLPLKLANILSKRKNSEDLAVPVKKKREAEKPESEDSLSGSDSKEENEVGDAKPAPMENLSNIQKLLNDTTYLSKDANPECECPVCAEKFVSIYILKQHVPYHLGETQCQICGKTMTRMDLLKKHLAQIHKIYPNSAKKIER